MSVRHAHLPSTLLLSLAFVGGVGCQPKGEKVSVVSDDAGPPRSNAPAPAPEPRQVAPVAKVRARGSIKELGDMLTALDRFATGVNPSAPMNSRNELQAMLLGSGFGPGAFEALDLDGTFALEAAWPIDDQPQAGPADNEMWGQIPTTDARRLIDAMPSTFAPQPFGDGKWQLTDGELRVMLAEAPGALRFALAPEHLDRVQPLADDQAAGRRVRVRVWDIPADDLDVAELLGLGDGPMARRVGEVIAQTEAVEGEMDFGTDRDLVLLGAVEAPFGKLGLGPIGKARPEGGPVTANLPDDAVAAFTMSWGNPKLLHATLDRFATLDQIPAPFDTPAREGLRQLHKLLDQLRDEIVVAVYVVPKSGVAIVVGGSVRDTDKARAQIRGLLESATTLLSSYAAVVAQDPQQRFKVSFKPDGARLSGVQADQMTVTVPASLEPELGAMRALVGAKQPRLEVYSMVVDEQAFVAFGVGGRKLLSDVARTRGKRKTSLERDGGLSAARAADGGCQICLVVDPKETVRLMLLGGASTSAEEKAQLAKHRATLDRLRLEGAASLSLRVAEQRGSLALGVPKTLLFADPVELEQLAEIVRSVDLD